VAYFDFAMYHNLGPSRINVHYGSLRSMFEYKKNEYSKLFVMPHGGFWYCQVTPSQVIGI
jgi:hypothetical protein